MRKLLRTPITCTHCSTTFTPTTKQVSRINSGSRPYCNPLCARAAQVQRLSKPPTPEQLTLILKHYEAGTKLKEISALTGIDSSTISKLAVSHGLKPRIAYKPHRTKKPGSKGSWYTIVTIKSRVGRIDNHKKTHLARCKHCNGERWYQIDSLDKVQSCGCRVRENRAATRKARGTGHGHTSRTHKSVEYQAWCNFRSGCRRSTRPQNVYDPRWDDFKLWLSEVGPKPHPFYCFTRIDTSKAWVPGNVHWILRMMHEQYDVTDHWDQHLKGPSKQGFNSKLKRQGAANPIIG